MVINLFQSKFFLKKNGYQIDSKTSNNSKTQASEVDQATGREDGGKFGFYNYTHKHLQEKKIQTYHHHLCQADKKLLEILKLFALQTWYNEEEASWSSFDEQICLALGLERIGILMAINI